MKIHQLMHKAPRFIELFKANSGRMKFSLQVENECLFRWDSNPVQYSVNI